MICPHCGQGIHFEEQEDKPIYSYDKLDKAGLGVELAHGFCPQCEEIIIILREGKYKTRGEFDEILTDISKEEILYHKVVLPRALDNSIPAIFRNDFKAAYAVLTLSPKASAAISRQLLQHILR